MVVMVTDSTDYHKDRIDFTSSSVKYFGHRIYMSVCLFVCLIAPIHWPISWSSHDIVLSVGTS